MTDSKNIEDGGPNLSALIEKLEKAEGPSRDLDVEIMNALDPRSPDEKRHFDGKLYQATWGSVGQIRDQIRYFVEAPHLTSSIDAAVVLAERLFPGARFSLYVNHLTGRSDGKGSRVQITRGKGPKCPHTGIRWPRVAGECFYASTLPMAIVAATLRALQSRGAA